MIDLIKLMSWLDKNILNVTYCNNVDKTKLLSSQFSHKIVMILLKEHLRCISNSKQSIFYAAYPGTDHVCNYRSCINKVT